MPAGMTRPPVKDTDLVSDCRLEVVDGHLIADLGGRFLLDTGSPVSFSTTGRANWGGRDCELPTSALGLDADELANLVGEPLDGLIGGDLLGLRPFTIDLERRVCRVDEVGSDRDTTEVRIRLVLGVPPRFESRRRLAAPGGGRGFCC